MFRRLELPAYSQIKHHEGAGNFAVTKYYKWPYRFFYRQKLRMIVNLLEKDRIYKNILDFGAGPGIFTPELKKHALFVTSVNNIHEVNNRWKFDVIICASVLEFLDQLGSHLWILENLLAPGGKIIVASPMTTPLTKAYFDAIGDKHPRHSHEKIMVYLKGLFNIERQKTWFGLYFAVKASKK